MTDAKLVSDMEPHASESGTLPDEAKREGGRLPEHSPMPEAPSGLEHGMLPDATWTVGLLAAFTRELPFASVIWYMTRRL